MVGILSSHTTASTDLIIDEPRRRLADIDSNGRLTRDEFARALYLIQLAQRGELLPSRSPESLVSAPIDRNEPPFQPATAIADVCADSIIEND